MNTVPRVIITGIPRLSALSENTFANGEVLQFLLFLLPPICALLAVRWIFPYILRIAKSKQLVDNPGERKVHHEAVPVLGGIAVIFGSLVGSLAYSIIGSGEGAYMPIAITTFIIMYVGAIDDILGLTATKSFVIEILVVLALIYSSGMCVDSLHGLWGVYTFSWWFAVPLTVIGGVGLINAYNMVDGVNGLSSGLGVLGTFVMGLVFYARHDMASSTLAFCVCAGLLVFYAHNVFGMKSKMFIGDSGTMSLGLLFIWFAILHLSSTNVDAVNCPVANCSTCHVTCLIPNVNQVALMLSVCSVPVFDTLRVMTGRLLRHESPFHADNTHLHHMLLRSGAGHFVTSLFEVILNILVIVLWYVTYRCGMGMDMQLYVTVFISMFLVWGTFWFLRFHEHHTTKAFARLKQNILNTRQRQEQFWLRLQEYVDR